MSASSERDRKWRKVNPEAARAASKRYKASEKGKTTTRARHLLQKYGLTMERYEEMQREQGDCCALCREPFNGDIAVDHDHATGQIRGLLHRKCNAALGGLGDDYQRVQLAARYLHRTHLSSIHPWACIGEPPEHRDWSPGMRTFYPEIHPTARLNAFVTVDAGLQDPTRVGAGSFLMTKSHVGHDAQVGVGCELAPGTVLGGHVVLEDRVRCGIGVMVRPGIHVGAGARLGAGAVVVKDVPAGEVWAGNPARRLTTAPKGIVWTRAEEAGWDEFAIAVQSGRIPPAGMR